MQWNINYKLHTHNHYNYSVQGMSKTFFFGGILLNKSCYKMSLSQRPHALSNEVSKTTCESAWGLAKWHSNFSFSIFLPISLSFYYYYFFYCYPKVHIILFYCYLINSQSLHCTFHYSSCLLAYSLF